MANFPSRCQHLKVNGTQCGSPALRRNRFCFFHKRSQDERIKLGADRARRGVATFVLPVLEDANSIQVALMQVMRLLVSQQIEHKTASLLLYALQTASTNLHLTRFDPKRHDVVLDPRTVPTLPALQPSGKTKASRTKKTIKRKKRSKPWSAPISKPPWSAGPKTTSIAHLTLTSATKLPLTGKPPRINPSEPPRKSPPPAAP